MNYDMKDSSDGTCPYCGHRSFYVEWVAMGDIYPDRLVCASCMKMYGCYAERWRHADRERKSAVEKYTTTFTV